MGNVEGMSLLYTQWETLPPSSFAISMPNLYAVRISLPYKTNTALSGAWILDIMYKDLGFSPDIPPRTIVYKLANGEYHSLKAESSTAGELEGSTIYSFRVLAGDAKVIITQSLSFLEFIDHRQSEARVRCDPYPKLFAEMFGCIQSTLIRGY